MWCVVLQLLSGLQAIHAYGLSCRVVDARHVLETERNRYRLGSGGGMDVLEPRSNQRELQLKDCVALGQLAVALGSRGSAVVDVKTLAVRYSAQLVEVVGMLLQGQSAASEVLARCTPQLVKTLNSALSTTDTFYTALVRGGWRREA